MKMTKKMKSKIFWFLLLISLSACHHNGARESTTTASFDDGVESFLKGQDEKAERAFRIFLKINPDHLYVGDAHYHLGRINHKRGEFTRARDEFKKAVIKARREETQVLAQRYLGKTYLEDPNPQWVLKRAELALEIFIDLKEKHSHLVSMPETLYHIGKCYLQLSEIQKAQKAFRLLVKDYSKNIWTKEVKKRKLTDYQNYFVQMGAFKDYKACKKLIDKLKPQGFKPYMHKDAQLFTVRVGPFKSYLLARQESTKLKNLKFSAILKP